jgi:hypothetical protein
VRKITQSLANCGSATWKIPVKTGYLGSIMEPYYEDNSIQIVQFKGPTSLEEIQRALVAFLADDVDHRKFMLELQRAQLDFDFDDASELFLYLDEYLAKLKHRLVVVVIGDDQLQRPVTKRLIDKIQSQIDANPHIAIANDLAQAHELFADMDANKTP